MTRRAMLAALLLPVAATACAPQPPDFSYAGTGDPLYVAMTTAQRNLTDLGRYRGQPALAALALGQYEFIMAELMDRVANPNLTDAQYALIRGGQAEIRRTLGMPSDAAARQVSNALRRFAFAVRAGDRAGAMRALSDPAFTFGAERTLQILTNLPPLYAVESAASTFNSAAGNLSDNAGFRL